MVTWGGQLITDDDAFWDEEERPTYRAQMRRYRRLLAAMMHFRGARKPALLVKSVHTLPYMDAIAAEFPGAKFLWLHRDAKATIPSIAALHELVHDTTLPGPRRVRDDSLRVVNVSAKYLLHGLKLRRQLEPQGVVFADSGLAKYKTDPLGTMRRVLVELGVPGADDDAAMAPVAEWVEAENRQRTTGTARKRPLAELGLDDAEAQWPAEYVQEFRDWL